MAFSGIDIGALLGPIQDFFDKTLTSASLLSTAAMVCMHSILFSVYIYLFVQNRRSRQWIVFVSAVVMFLLSTADIVVSFRIVLSLIPGLAGPKIGGVPLALIRTKESIFVANNFVADLILLYRCWTVCGRSKYILTGCSLLVLGDTIWGFLGLVQTLSFLSFSSYKFIPVYIWSILALNIVLSLVTITRIFWVSRIAQKLGGQKEITAYHTAIAILVESSLVYLICLSLYISFPSSNSNVVVVMLICMRVVAIMPTLLIVQVRLRAAMRERNVTGLSTLRFEVRSQLVVSSTIGSVMLRDEGHRQAIVFRPSLDTIESEGEDKSKMVTFDDRQPRALDDVDQTITQ